MKLDTVDKSNKKSTEKKLYYKQRMEPQQPTNTEEQPVEAPKGKELNMYPIMRHLFLVFCVLLTATIVFILIYQNGKSIYENGL